MNLYVKQCLAGLVVWLCGVAEPCRLWAQFQQRVQTDELFLTAPRALQRLLTEGRTAIEEGRYADGVSALGTILQGEGEAVADDLQGRDFFVDRPVRSVYSKSLKSEAIEVLNGLPTEGRRILELQFGVKARQLLDAAIDKRDLVAIAEVARRFVHTDAGYDAMVLIAQTKLSSGYPLAAADILQTLLDFPAARQRYGVQLAYFAAMAWQQAGKEVRAAKTLELAGRDFAGQSITVSGRQVPIEEAKSILQIIQTGGGVSFTENTTSDWLTAGGSPSRTATSKLGMPLPNERWEWFIHSSRPEGQALRKTEESLRKAGTLLLPKLELRLLDNTVISRSNDSTIVGIDFQTGMLLWRRPSSAGVAPLKRGAWESGDKSLSEDLLNRIWGSTAFGRITCDNQRCYHVVHTQDEVEVVRGTLTVASSRLEGISIAKQGAILWSLGGSDGDEPQLASAYFLGPPLPYGGQLYSLVEINGETELIVLDPETGKLRWRQQLASAALVPISVDRARQSQALTPSIADGVIVCPTGVGGVVAIDLLTRSLRWGAIYPTRGLNAGFNSPLLNQDYEPLQSRWLDEGLMVDNGVVAFTPPESDLLFCYDLLSGEKLLESRRGQACYVAGIDGSNLVTVAADQVLFENIQTKEKKSIKFPDGLMLVGKGIWQDGLLMLPLTNNRLIQIDLRKREIIAQATVAQPLGNIFAHRGQMLSVGSNSITAYHTRSELEREVQTRLAANPQDAWGLNYSSQLLLSEGKTKEAMQQLLTAYTANPNDDDTRYFLSDVMLTGLREDFAHFVDYANQLDSVVQATPQRLRYLQLMAQGMAQQQDNMGAFQRLWEIMKEQQSAFVSGAQSRTNRNQLTDNHWADAEIWFATELGRCYAQCNDSQQEEIRKLVADECARIRQTVLPVRRQLMRYLSQLPPADAENIDLAKELIKRQEQTQAEQVLGWLASSSVPSSRTSSAQLLQQLSELDRNLLGDESHDMGSSVWKQGMVIDELGPPDSAIYSVGRPIEMTSQRYGRPPFSIAAWDRALSLSDANGKPLYNLQYRPATSDLAGTFMSAEVRGGLILMETVAELVAFDFYRGSDKGVGQSMLWRYSLDTTTPQETFQPAHMLVSTDEPLGIQVRRRKSDNRKYAEVGPLLANVKIVQSGNSIIGLDPYSGRQLWSRDGYSDQVRFAGGPDSDELSVVNPTAGKTERIDGRDGKLLGESQYLVEEMQQRFRSENLNKWNHWFSSGNWLVDYRGEDTSSKQILRAWNPRTEQILAELVLPKSARVAHCDRNAVAILDTTGHLTLIDLAKGLLHKYDVPVDKDLASVGIVRFANHFVVVASRSSAAQRQPLSPAEVSANGYLYSIDDQTRQLAWSQPGRLTNMAIPLLQPRNSPYLAAYRFIPSQDLPLSASLIILDLRSGRLAHAREGIRIQADKSFSMQLRPHEQQVAMALGERNFRFQITDQPPPPEPIVRFGGVYEKPLTIKRDEKSLFK